MVKYLMVVPLFLKCYLWNVLVAFDQTACALLGGSPDVTISSRAWGWHLRGVDFPYKLIDSIPCFGVGHCERAYEPEPLDKSVMANFKKEWKERYGGK